VDVARPIQHRMNGKAIAAIMTMRIRFMMVGWVEIRAVL